MIRVQTNNNFKRYSQLIHDGQLIEEFHNIRRAIRHAIQLARDTNQHHIIVNDNIQQIT